jgi:hypothetical protein
MAQSGGCRASEEWVGMSIGLQGFREPHGSCDGDRGRRTFLVSVLAPKRASLVASGCAAWMVQHNALVHRALVRSGGATVLGWMATRARLALVLLRGHANAGTIA